MDDTKQLPFGLRRPAAGAPTTSADVLTRAFELARSPAVNNMTELRKALKAEGQSGLEVHLTASPSLGRQLAALITAPAAAETAP